MPEPTEIQESSSASLASKKESTPQSRVSSTNQYYPEYRQLSQQFNEAVQCLQKIEDAERRDLDLVMLEGLD